MSVEEDADADKMKTPQKNMSVLGSLTAPPFLGQFSITICQIQVCPLACAETVQGQLAFVLF